MIPYSNISITILISILNLIKDLIEELNAHLKIF